MKPIDLTHFVFNGAGMLPKQKGGLLNFANAWNTKYFLKKIPIGKTPYRPEGKNDVYYYGSDNAYQFSDVLRNLGHAKIIEDLQQNGNPNNLDHFKKESVPGTTLNELPMMAVGKDLLHLPINRGGKRSVSMEDTLWKGDFRHTALFVLSFDLNRGHFHTRSWSGTPGADNSCSFHSLSEMFATMKMTSLKKLREKVLNEHGGLSTLKTAAKEYDNTKEDLKKQIKELSNASSTIYRQMQLKSGDERESLNTEMKAIGANITQLKSQLRDLKHKSDVYQGLESLDEGIKAGHTDLLELHLEKLNGAVAKHNASIGAHQNLFETARQTLHEFNHMANKMEKRHANTKKEKNNIRPKALSNSLRKAKLDAGIIDKKTQQLVARFMLKAQKKIPLHRRKTPKYERLNYVTLQVRHSKSLTLETLQQHLREFMQTAVIPSSLVDSNSKPEDSTQASALLNMHLQLDHSKPTNTGKACFNMLQNDSYRDITNIAFDTTPKEYESFLTTLNTAPAPSNQTHTQENSDPALGDDTRVAPA